MTEVTETLDSTEALARFAASCFETAHRNDDLETFDRVRDGSPDWLTDLCREAHSTPHGLMFPDDWRYSCISAALDAIADGSDLDDGSHEFADSFVDTYNADRLAWLGSHQYRAYYVDDARSEGLTDPDADTLDAIAAGQYVEALEVFVSVWESLSAQVGAS